MAFGFPASYETQCDRAGSRQAARDAAAYAFDLLGWKYKTVNVDLFHARVPMTGMSWGERFIVSLESPGIVEIKSSCLYPLQLFDLGKNKRNVEQFLIYFAAKELRETMLPPGDPLYMDEAGNTPVDRLKLED